LDAGVASTLQLHIVRARASHGAAATTDYRSASTGERNERYISLVATPPATLVPMSDRVDAGQMGEQSGCDGKGEVGID
jgi:hypothetical protein